MKTKFEDLQPEQLRRLISSRREGEYLLIDVRQPGEYEQGHIPGAKLIPVMELVRTVHDLPAEKDLIFYCRSGSRSAAAATLAGEELKSGNRIFNLAGGILAWDGHKVEGWPKLKLFKVSAIVDESFRMAMDLEKGAQRFYTYLADRFKNEPWAAVFNELARAERAHARTIYGYWQKSGGTSLDFDTLYGRLEGEIIEGGKSLIEVLEQVVQVKTDRCVQLMELALSVENSAFDLYRTLAGLDAEEEISTAFLGIAQAEKAHMQTLINNIGTCSE